MVAKSNDRKRYQICFKDVSDIKTFVDAAKSLEGECELISGRYRVDAKSLIAVFTLPIGNRMELEVEQMQTELPEQIRKYIS